MSRSEPVNEPVFDFAPGSPERRRLREELGRQSAERVDVPLVIAGREDRPGVGVPSSSPHRHDLVVGGRYDAGPAEVDAAIAAGLSAKGDWAALSFDERAAVFLRAADLLSGPWRPR